jgi:hypothetical protein
MNALPDTFLIVIGRRGIYETVASLNSPTYGINRFIAIIALKHTESEIRDFDAIVQFSRCMDIQLDFLLVNKAICVRFIELA